MSEKLTERASAMLAINRRHSLRSAALVIASIAVALLTTWFFVFPATSASDFAYCGVEEHQHTAECYAANLVCDVGADSPTTESHTHTDACYATEQVLSCGLEKGQEASESSDKANEPAGSQDAGTYDIGVEETDRDASGANSPEGTAANVAEDNSSVKSHVHTDACYEQASALACGLEEGDTLEVDAHAHDDSCYEQILSCATEEHTHTLSCYSNPGADVETAADWEATLPSELSGVWADDLIAIAESQLGYAESEDNYLVTDEGKLKGYSRYGAWYGEAYGDWCAMFISFCLSYAGIPEDSFPQEANCQSWTELLSSEGYQLYYPVGEYAVRAADAISAGEIKCDGVPADALTYFDANELYAPLPGDIVFFNWDSSYDSDHVGIVVEVTEATEDEPAKLKTIEGNASDHVKCCEYDLDDPSIMGYGMLPIKPEGEAITLETGSGGVSLLGESSTIVPTGEGYYYGKNDKYFYQDSSHRIDGGLVTTFLLVKDELRNQNVTLTPAKGTEWTAKSSSNFIAAYCCDLETSVGTSPVDFTSYLLEESRISDPALQAKLSAIVAHSYPFISSADMKAELEAAKVECCSSCGANEYLAAVQWAIWELTTLNGDLSGATEHSFGLNSTNVHNRLNSVGHTESSKISSHVKAIKEYLIDLPAYQGMMEVSSYESSVTLNSDGTYSLTVAIKLNRAMRGDESLSAYLQTGAKKSDTIAVQAESSQVILTVSGLTEAELYDTEVSLVGTGAHMQAYFFDSEDKQDMLGGRWESYPLDLSFELSRDTTVVSVTKSWTDDESHPDSVSVQLVRNGADYGDPITLSANNKWTYSWTELPKFDYQNAAYVYTVREIVPAGYSSSVTEIQESGSTTQVWKSVDAFTSGKTYVLVSSIGALGTGSQSSSKLTWGAYDLTPASDMSNLVRWTVSTSGDGWTLTNQANNKKLKLDSSSISYGSNGSTFYLTADKKLYSKSGSSHNKTNRYLTGIENGTGKTTTDASKGTVLTIYELQTVDAPATGQSFLITNTPVETTSVTIEKKWADSNDPYRPESIQVTLLASGQSVETVDVTAAENWTYMWEDLPLFDNSGKAIAYSVEEVTLKGYDVEIVADGNHFTIKNIKDYYVLPETGGIGAGVLMTIGVGLIGVFVTSFTVWLRKRREEV